MKFEVIHYPSFANLNKYKVKSITWKSKWYRKYRSSRPKVFCKKVFLEKAYNFIKKETLAQVLSYEFCQISQKTFFLLLKILISLDATHLG